MTGSAHEPLPKLDLILRPSLRPRGEPALVTTVPLLVLPHDRLESFATRQWHRGQLLGVDLGKKSMAVSRASLHPVDALNAEPLLRSLYDVLRGRPARAWLFFGPPSACEPAVRRALALYHLFWHRIVSRSQLIGSPESVSAAAKRAAEHRQTWGPSFVFVGAGADPLAGVASRQEETSKLVREARLEPLASTLAAVADMFRPHSSPASSPPREIGLERMRALAQPQRDEAAPAPLAGGPQGHEGGETFAVVDLSGDVEELWRSLAVEIVACPLPSTLFRPPSGGAVSRCPVAEVRESAAFAVRHRGGVKRAAFVAAAKRLVAEEDAEDGGELLDRRLRWQFRAHNPDAGAHISTDHVVGALADGLYEGVEKVLLDPSTPAPSPAPVAALGADDDVGSAGSDSATSMEPPWEPVHHRL